MESTHDVALMMLVDDSINEDRDDLTLRLEITEEAEEKSTMFHRSTLEYFDVPADDTAELRLLVLGCGKVAKEEGVEPTLIDDTEDDVKIKWDGLSREDALSVQQIGIMLVEMLGDKGLHHAEKKGKGFRKAEKIRDRRRQGIFGYLRETFKGKKKKDQ